MAFIRRFRNEHSKLKMVKGLTYSQLRRICTGETETESDKSSNFNLEKIPQKTLRKLYGAYNPKFNTQIAKDIEDIVALHLSSQCLSFTHFTRDCIVKDWLSIPVLPSRPNYNIHSLLKRCKEIAAHIPDADMHIFEERLTRPRFLGAVPIMITTATLEGMLLTILSSRRDGTNDDYKKLNDVYTVKYSTIANNFNLKIGRERVSGQHIISDIIDGTCSMQNLNRVNLDYRLIEMYKEAPSVLKEQLCNSFILGLFVLQTINT